MKRDKGKKGGGRETQKKSGFPLGLRAPLFQVVTKTLLYSFKSKRWFNKRKSNVLWLNHLWDIEEQKCFWNTLKKRTPQSEWGRGGNPLFFCVSLPPPFFPLSLFISNTERERGGDGARPITGYVYGFITKLMTYYRMYKIDFFWYLCNNKATMKRLS